MRVLLPLVIVALGVAIACLPWWPSALREVIPATVAQEAETGRTRLIALLAAGIAALLLVLRWRLGRRGAGGGIDDRALRTWLKRHGFVFDEFAQGWQARARWQGEAISVRLDGGYHAGRFGRSWVLLLTAPGRPLDPLPVPREQAVVSEAGADGFTVILPEARLGTEPSLLSERIDAVLAARR